MKYSVIIPVYNAEKTIRRCLDSLLKQHRQDVEILIVNDGSTDSSHAICKELAKKHSQIRYIQKENGGVSSARNEGLDNATGEYIVFVDSDDYVAEEYFYTLDSFGGQWDFLQFSYYAFDGNQYARYLRNSFCTADQQLFLEKLSEYLYRKLINSPCNKRYKRDIIAAQNLRFHSSLSVGEDALFNLKYALTCKSALSSEQFLYTVSVENRQSLSRRIREDLLDQLALGEREMLDAIRSAQIDENSRKKLLEAMNFLVVSEVYSSAKRMHISKCSLKCRYIELYRLCNKIRKKKLTVPDSRYCKLLYLPVRLRLVTIVDIIGRKLAQ